jgi:hypothetical protein
VTASRSDTVRDSPTTRRSSEFIAQFNSNSRTLLGDANLDGEPLHEIKLVWDGMSNVLLAIEVLSFLLTFFYVLSSRKLSFSLSPLFTAHCDIPIANFFLPPPLFPAQQSALTSRSGSLEDPLALAEHRLAILPLSRTKSCCQSRTSPAALLSQPLLALLRMFYKA